MTYGRRTEFSFGYYATKGNDVGKGWYGQMMVRVRKLRDALKHTNDAEANNLVPLRNYLTIKSTELTKGATRQEIVNTYENIVAALLAELNRLDHTGYEAYQEHRKVQGHYEAINQSLQHRTEQAAEGAQRIIFREQQILSLIDLIHPQPSLDGTPYVDLDNFYQIGRP